LFCIDNTPVKNETKIIKLQNGEYKLVRWKGHYFLFYANPNNSVVIFRLPTVATLRWDDTKLFVYVNFPLQLHFLNAYCEKTKSVTPIFYNRFRCISLRTTTMQKFKQIWIYAIWYRPTLRTKQRTKIHHICLLKMQFLQEINIDK
jgi:hypothetical protein